MLFVCFFKHKTLVQPFKHTMHKYDAAHSRAFSLFYNCHGILAKFALLKFLEPFQ